MQYPHFGRHVFVEPMDLFRLQPGAVASDFTDSPRVLYTDGDQATDDAGTFNPPVSRSRVSLPVTPNVQGVFHRRSLAGQSWEGFQCDRSFHCITDPTAAPGEVEQFTDADRIDFELLGYHVKPLPAAPNRVVPQVVDLGHGRLEIAYTWFRIFREPRSWMLTSHHSAGYPIK